MKRLTNRFTVFMTGAFFCMICVSWTSGASGSVDAFKKFLETTDLSVTGSFTTRDHTMIKNFLTAKNYYKKRLKRGMRKPVRTLGAADVKKVTDPVLIQQLTKMALAVPKKESLHPSVDFIYSMSQTGTPYRDANIEVYVDDINGDMLFWDDNRTINKLWHSSHYVEIDCPIFDQWAAAGTYHLNVFCMDRTTWNFYSYLTNAPYKDGTNTPDIYANYHAFNLDMLNPFFIDLVFITLTAS